jgi:hypothetical protein
MTDDATSLTLSQRLGEGLFAALNSPDEIAAVAALLRSGKLRPHLASINMLADLIEREISEMAAEASPPSQLSSLAQDDQADQAEQADPSSRMN